jgi:hypothetical protein
MTSLKKRNYSKKTGSNLKIQGGEIQLEFRGAWKTIEKHGRIAQANAAPENSGAALVGKSVRVSHLAERAGFEPAMGFKPHTAFPVLLLRPLGHLSKIERESLLKPFATHQRSCCW